MILGWGTQNWSFGSKVVTLTFPTPVRLFRVSGTLSYTAGSMQGRVLRETLVWLQGSKAKVPPGVVVAVSPPADPDKSVRVVSAVSPSVWQCNVKSYGESLIVPVLADLGPDGVLLPDGVLFCCWSQEAWSGSSKVTKPEFAMNSELQLNLTYEAE